MARWALFSVAATQMLLAAPALLLGDSAGATIHVARELGAFDMAVAAGLLVAAGQPWRAGSLLPLAWVLAVAVLATTVLDLIEGSTTLGTESHHLFDLCGLALLWLVARQAGADGARPSARRPGSPRIAPTFGTLRPADPHR